MGAIRQMALRISRKQYTVMVATRALAALTAFPLDGCLQIGMCRRGVAECTRDADTTSSTKDRTPL